MHSMKSLKCTGSQYFTKKSKVHGKTNIPRSLPFDFEVKTKMSFGVNAQITDDPLGLWHPREGKIIKEKLKIFSLAPTNCPRVSEDGLVVEQRTLRQRNLLTICQVMLTPFRPSRWTFCLPSFPVPPPCVPVQSSDLILITLSCVLSPADLPDSLSPLSVCSDCKCAEEIPYYKVRHS